MILILTSAIVADAIRKVIDGKLSRKELSAWAFECFLGHGENRLSYEPGAREIISKTIRTLVSMDEGPEYDLTDQELRHLEIALQSYPH